MIEPLIPGGYILLSRKLIDSEIWNKPPLYIKVWIYLLCRAQHDDYKNLNRGQLITSIPEIQEACSWQVGYRKVKPSKDQVFQVIEWLRDPIGKISRKCCAHVCEQGTKATMITTMKATQGLFINIDNYAFYQDPKNYEGNDDGNNEKPTKATRKQRQPDNINKNDKNDNNELNIYINSETENLSPTELPQYEDEKPMEPEPKPPTPQEVVFEHWNSKGIIRHKKLTDKIRRSINGALKDYNQDELCKAINNYAIILTDEKYYWTHKWTLKEFLDRGIEKFLDFKTAAENYKTDKKIQKEPDKTPFQKAAYKPWKPPEG